jgi:hypothetical protein
LFRGTSTTWKYLLQLSGSFPAILFTMAHYDGIVAFSQIDSRPIQRSSSRNLTTVAQKASLVIEVVTTFSSFQVP